MKNLLIYTFRTNPFKDKLIRNFPESFIFGKLKEDFQKFSELITRETPSLVLGIASSNSSSRFEPIAINQFNVNKKIVPMAPTSLPLFIPRNVPLETSKITTDSFCNWSMYQIANFIENNELDTKLSFAHVNEEDVDDMINWIKSEEKSESKQ